MVEEYRQWHDDSILNNENPLTPSVAAEVLSERYNIDRTIGSVKWRQSKQPGWQGEEVEDTRKEDIGKIMDGLLKTSFGMNMTSEQAMGIWKKLQPFLVNPEFARFVLDTHAAESRFFFSWLSCVPRAITLEAHFGYAPDLTGNFRRVPKSDPFWYWTQADPGLKLVGYRYEKTQELMIDKPDVLDLASGWFQWLRHGHYCPEVEKQVIYSCDLDPAVDPGYILNPSVAGCTLTSTAREKIDIHHRQLDVRLMIKQMLAENRQFDAVDAGGILSYMMDDYDEICSSVVKLLKPGGVFIHDLQLMHWCMKRDGAMFGWSKNESNIQLMENPETAKARIGYVFSGLKDLTYELDFEQSNAEPLAVLVTARRMA